MVKLILNKYNIKSCLILSILFLLYGLLNPSEAMAGVFDPPVTDKSVEYLGLVFGNNIGGLHLGTSTETSAFLGNLFEKLNGIVVAIATVVLLYTSILSTVNTAQDGEIMGKKWSSVWIPLRSSMGLLLLAPIPGSGYSLIQVAVMWIVLNGIGAADTIWNTVAESIASGINVVQNEKNSDQLSNLEVRSLITNATMIAPNIFRSLVCLELLNKYIIPEDLSLLQGNPGPYFTDPIENSSGELSASLKFGVQTASGAFSAMKDICGSTTITVAPLIRSEMQGITELSLTNEQTKSIKLAAFEIKKTALKTLMSSMNDLANTITRFEPDNLSQAIPLLSEGALSNGILGFQGIMSGLSKEQLAIKLGLQIKSITNNLPAVLANVKATGWILAGAYYYTFNQQNNKTLLKTAYLDPPTGSSAFNKGIITGESTPISINIDLPSFNRNTSNFPLYSTQLNNSILLNLFKVPEKIDSAAGDDSLISPVVIGGMTAAFLAFNPIAAIPLVGFLWGMKALIDDLVNQVSNVHRDPIITIAHAGQALMTTTEVLWIAFTVVLMVLSIPSGIMSAYSPGELMLTTFLLTVFPIIIGIIGMLWVFGSLLAVYIPLVPFMIFAVTVVSWFISVVEAIVAAPIVALGLISPSQEELGTIKPAIGMLTSIFLKPMLMIIGLLFAGKVFKILLIFVTVGFKNTTKILNNPSMFSWVCILGVYTGFIIALLNKSYSLIYHLPDKVLSWIGVSGEGTDTGAVEKAKASHDQATSAVKGMQDGTTDGLIKNAKEGNVKGRENAIEAENNKKAEEAKSKAAAETAAKPSTTDAGGKPGDGGGGEEATGGGGKPATAPKDSSPTDPKKGSPI